MPTVEDRLIECLAAIGETDEVVPLRARVVEALSLFGMDSLYFVAPLAKDPRAGRVLTNIGLPRIWERHYRARLFVVDPLPTLSLRFSNAFYWPDDLAATELTSKQQHYLRIASRYGLERGIGVACYGPRGRSGFLGVRWDSPEPPPRRTLLAVHQIGQTSFQRYCQIMQDDIDIEPFSNRELEVLGWMCQGRSNPEIATSLGISRSTVDAYIRRIFAKLDVTDRTTACVRAYSSGILVSDEVLRLTGKLA